MTVIPVITYAKDPQAVLDYTLDWSAWLGSDTISTAVWAADTGLTVNSTSKTTTSATAWLAGGSDGTTYNVKNTITTAGGRTDERTIAIEVRQL